MTAPEYDEQPGTGTPIEGDAEACPDIVFTGPFWQQVAKRRKQERDAKIIITAEDGATGVGKTALAVYLAKALDQSEDGFLAAEKATVSVSEFLNLYDEVEPRSALILDEAEQIDSRRSMSNENIDAARKWETHRVNEIAGILTLPSPESLDKRMEGLADYWINVEARGKCRIYEKRIHRIKRELYYKTLQTQGWPNMDRDPDYKALAKMKEQMISDPESENNWIRQSTVDERVAKAEKQARKELRNSIAWALKNQCGLSPSTFEPAFDVSKSHLYTIARGEANTGYYCPSDTPYHALHTQTESDGGGSGGGVATDGGETRGT